MKHGDAKDGGSKEYIAWRGMIARCRGTASKEYYADRGISIDPEWASDFSAFLTYVGRAPTSRHTIDRIDSLLGYHPGNVRWATPKQQARNRGNGVYVTIDGSRMLLVEAAEKYSIDPWLLRNRLARGWDAEKAIRTPRASQFARIFPKRVPQHTATRPIVRRIEA